MASIFLTEASNNDNNYFEEEKGKKEVGLTEPLLLKSSDVDEFRAELQNSINRMESTSDDTNDFSTTMNYNPIIRGTVAWCLRIRTLADALPPLFQPIVAGGKMSLIFFIGFQLLLMVLILPLYLLSFIVTEIGLYLIFVFIIFLVGRAIIRMIAFPGSSSRISREIEKEFTKYSVSIITSSADSIIDFAAAIQETHGGNEYEITSLWKRARSYRDRVLGVYSEVLNYILEECAESSNPSSLNKYGNNTLKGDVGNLSTLLSEAKDDGRTLLKQLKKILTKIDAFEDQAKPIIEVSKGGLPDSVRQASNELMTTATELKNFVESLKSTIAGDTSTLNIDSDDENFSVSQISSRLEEEQHSSGSLIETLRVGFSSILPMLDPPLNASIFGFDVLRGCLLSRYFGARQFWVQRPGGGMIDCLHIPAKITSLTPESVSSYNSKAVLYCNPNAGLIEVATGMSLAGGNVSSDPLTLTNDNCWTDFYTNLGYDMYMFNYAGFGRSYGKGYFGICESNNKMYVPGIWAKIKRICYGTFFGFNVNPDSLRADGLAVSKHIISQMGVESLVIHGESIGGVAASATARKLTEENLKDKVSLLICDRTFCNLEAVAQRLVGGWSGYAIRILAPFWSTDVVGDFLAASCPKVVANDAADAIIADSSSLKSGISLWKEIKRSASSTRDLGWMVDAPLHLRMADWENVSVNDSQYVSLRTAITAPVWPADKKISMEEAFHFAACTKRIGKLASIEKKRYEISMSTSPNDTERGSLDSSCQSPIYVAWRYLGCCEGLCGLALGVTVKGGFDNTVSWLSQLLIFGGQRVVEAIEHRNSWSNEVSCSKLHELGQVEGSDFDCRPLGFEDLENDSGVHPKPIPEVLGALKEIIKNNPNNELLNSVSHELSFVIDTLEYILARLSTPATLEANCKSRHLHSEVPMTEGSFMNLHCGHNNPYSDVERKRLKEILHKTTQVT